MPVRCLQPCAPMKMFKPLTREEMYEMAVDAADPIVPGGSRYRETLPTVTVDCRRCSECNNPAPCPGELPSCRPTDPASPVTNPKEGAGSQKPPTWSVMPRWVMLMVGRVMQIGAAKYDAFNYREAPITASTYEDAMERHAALWFDGEDNDPETGVSHLASIIASCSLLMDSQAGGLLVDNRQKTGKVRSALDKLDVLRVSMPLPPKNPNAPSLQKGGIQLCATSPTRS